MTYLKGSLKGEHLNGISFSAFSTLHVPAAQVHGDSALLETRPFQQSPANTIEFMNRVCTGGLPFRSATRWGDGIISDDAYGMELTIPNIQGSPADKMSFSLKSLYTEELDMLLRTELAYKSPAFYLLQFAELPIVISELDITIKKGVAATMIAGGATLLSFIASRHSVPLKGGFVALDDATAVANCAVHHEMALNASNFTYESTARGYGYSCVGSTIDEAPTLSVKFASDTTHISALHGHVLEGPSITILQNIPISAHGVHGSIEPIVRDLVLAAATMCPTLPLTKVV